MHCFRSSLLPYDYEILRFSRSNIVMKQKKEPTKDRWRKIKNNIWFKKAEKIKFHICFDECRTYEKTTSNDETFVVLPSLKKRYLYIKKETVEKYWNKNLIFQQNHFCGAAMDIHGNGHDSSRLNKWIGFDRLYKIINYYCLLASVFCALNELLKIEQYVEVKGKKLAIHRTEKNYFTRT